MSETTFEPVPAVAPDEPPAAAGTLVMKFGGTSVADPEKIRRVASRLVEAKRAGSRVVAVVSAMGQHTDELVCLAHEVSPQPKPREMDMLISVGERISCALVAMAIADLGLDAISLTGSQAGIVTDTVHGKAKIVEVRAHRIHEALDSDRIVLVAGFQGVSTDFDITTLGRGGTDTTAVALAAALGADACEIYTDVTGVFSADPRIVPLARKLTRVHFDEPGMEDPIISGVVTDANDAKVTVLGVPDQPGVSAALFEPLAVRNVVVDMIVQNTSTEGHTDISFTVPKADMTVSEQIVGQVAINIGKVSIVGAGMKTSPGIAAKMFRTLADADVNIEMISTSTIRISVVVAAADLERAARSLHTAFDLDGTQGYSAPLPERK